MMDLLMEIQIRPSRVCFYLYYYQMSQTYSLLIMPDDNYHDFQYSTELSMSNLDLLISEISQGEIGQYLKRNASEMEIYKGREYIEEILGRVIKYCSKLY